MRSIFRNREKRPMTVEQSERLESRRMHQQHLEDERRNKIRQDKIDLERKKEGREWAAYNFVKRMRNLEDKKGKDWVPSKEEFYDVHGTPFAIMDSWMEEKRFVENLYRSKGCTKDEKDVEMVRLRSMYEAKVKEHHESLWWDWFAFRDAQRMGVYDAEQALYAEMLQKLEEEDRREKAYGLAFCETDMQRLVEREKERERYMLEEYAVNLADDADCHFYAYNFRM